MNTPEQPSHEGRPGRRRFIDPAANPGTPTRFSGYAGRLGPYRLYPRPLSGDQRTVIVYGILSFILILIVLQLWLLTATMNAYLGGDDAVIWPAAAASVACLVLNVGLLRYLYAIERH